MELRVAVLSNLPVKPKQEKTGCKAIEIIRRAENERGSYLRVKIRARKSRKPAQRDRGRIEE